MGLKKMRRRAGLTQSQLAVLTGISYSSILAYEQETREIDLASYRTLKTLANVLNCSIDDLLDNKTIEP